MNECYIPRVQVIDLSTLRWGRDIQETWLSSVECARAENFVFPHDRETWRRGRAWVRREVAAMLNCAPAEIEWELEPYGRPSVRGAPSGFDVNWSHSASWIALGSTIGSSATRLGVDLEVHRAEGLVEETTALVCTPEEASALRRLPTEQLRSQFFYRVWTAKEALMKATGFGVALEPLSIALSWNADAPELTHFHSHPQWHLAQREHVAESRSWTLAVAWR